MPSTSSPRTARHVLVALALGSALTACDTPPGRTLPSPSLPSPATTAATSSEPAELAALRARPLRLPTLAAGQACPVTRAAPPDPAPPSGHPLGTGGPPSALGHAPVFPDARYFHGDRAELWVRADTTNPGWYSTKVPWASRTGYLGWVLIRTGRLDGPGRARVGLSLAGGPAISEALGVNVQADWQFWPGSTDVTAPGCYAYQVDGTSFTEIIVFHAELAPDRSPTTHP
jgi:hypothetical protein